MNKRRRNFLLGLLGLYTNPTFPLAKPKPVGDKLSLAIAAEIKGQSFQDSGQIQLEAPDIAEDGAIVPVTISTDLSGAERVWVFVEKNPTPLAARFQFSPELETYVSLRVKLNESCDVLALIATPEGIYSSRKAVRVVKGGCG